MQLFLIDGDKSYCYDDLLKYINNNKTYCPLLKSSNIFVYFANLIKALVTNQSLILLDSDLNPSEVEGVDESLINKEEILSYNDFTNISDVISYLELSKSTITIFTSGTTGQPKKVTHTISSLTRSTRKGERFYNQVWAYAYNPTHMAGLQVFFQAFCNVNTLVNVFNKQRSEIYECIRKYQITHISATPTFYRLLLPFEQTFESVLRVTLGGEKSDNHLYENIHRIFPSAKITNIYASTEAGSLFAAKDDCFQLPLNNRNLFKVINDELLIHRSLLGISESFKYEGDYYCTGDLIEWIDEEKGLFRFKSRKNELINVGGYKVNPNEVENVIREIDGIQEVIVYGKPNSVLGNILCADIKITPSSIFTELEIKKLLRNYLQDFKIPRRIKFVDELSLTRTGKLKRL